MSTWLEQFTANLDRIKNSRGNSTRKESSSDIAYRMLSVRTAKAITPKATPDAGFFDGSHWWDDKTSAGSRVLDVLGRVNYASANAAKSLVDDDQNGNIFSSAWEGLSGQKKTTYSDVLGTAGVTDPWIKGIAGFAGDVLLDPTTYVGAGAIRHAAKGTLKLGVGASRAEKLTKLGRAKNTLGTDSVFTTSTAKAKKELDDTGSTTTKSSNIQKILEAAKPKPSVAYNVEPRGISNIRQGQLAISGPPAANFVTDTAGTTKYKPWQNPTARLAAETHLSNLERKHADLLKGHESSRFSKDFTIDPLHRNVTSKVPEKFMEDVVTETPKLGVPEFANRLAVEHAIKTDARAAKFSAEKITEHANRIIKDGTYDVTKNGLKVYGREGKPATVDLGAKDLVNEKGFSHATDTIPASTISELAIKGKVPEYLKGYFVKGAGDKLLPIEKVIKDMHTSIGGHEVFGTGTKTTRQVENTRLVDKVTSEKLKPSEIAAWIAKYRDKLTPEEMAFIRKGSGNAKSVATRIAKITGGVSNKDFASITELRAAAKAGQLTPKAIAALKYRMHLAGIRNLPEIERKLTKAREAVLKAQNEVTKTKTTIPKPSPPKPKPKDTSDSIWANPLLVEDTANIIDDVLTKGNVPEGFVKPKVELAPQQASIVEDALRGANAKQFVDPSNPAKFGFKTNTGVPRNRPTPGVGLGVHNKGANKYFQLNIGQKIIQGASKLVRGTPDAIRPAAMYDTAMPMLLAAEQQVRKLGIPIILGKYHTGFPLSVHDALSALDRTFVEKFYFSGKADFGITQFADVIELYTRRGLGQLDEASVIANLEKLLSEPMTGSKTLSPLTKSLLGAGPDAIKVAAKEIDHYFTKATPKIITSLKHNSAEAAIKVGDETRALTDEVIAKFNEVISNPKYSAAEVMDTALNTSKLVDEAAKGRAIPVSGVSEGLAKDATASHAAASVPMASIKTASKGAEQFARATNTSETARVASKLSESASHEATIMMDEFKFNILDLGMKAEFGWGVGMFRAFAPHLGNELLRPILTARSSVGQSMSKKFTARLNATNKVFKAPEMNEALKTLQMNAERIAKGEDVMPNTPAMDAMQEVIKEMFGGGKLGLLSRNGIRAEHLQSKFKKYGIGDKYRLDIKDMDSSWTKWDIEDPLDFMSKFHAATTAAIAERQLGAEIGRMFGSKVPIKGSVRVIDPKGQSKLASLIDRELFFPDDIARQMHMIDKTLTELAQPNTSNAFLRVLDSATHSIKAGLTIYRPGHHARNMIGDMWLSSMDGVSASSYKRAIAVLHTQKGQFQDFDSLRALEEAYKVEGKAPKSVLNLKFKGKPVSFSPDEVYRMAFDNGVLPDYSVLEDIAFGGTQQADRVAEGLKKISPLRLIGKGGALHNTAAKASEVRDHYVRLAHFLSALEKGGPLKGKGATYEEQLADALKNASITAGNRVRKWHPDGSDLSHVEKNVMRRTILFYSWVRKAIPLVLETMVTKPGRFMLYPKATQNIAAMNGIDLEGFGDPFPVDQLFPSYIADSIQGPQWGETGSYMGMKPGIPSMDVMDDYGKSPLKTLQTIMGGLNPAIKIPTEVATGVSLRNRAPIKDTTDYIDSQIPNASYINKLAGGRSLTSGFRDPVTVAKSNEGYEGSESMAGGQSGQDFTNWLLGLGLTDYSKPSYIKAAQIERQRLRRQPQ